MEGIDPNNQDIRERDIEEDNTSDVNGTFAEGKRTRFDLTKDSNGNVTKGQCISRDCDYNTKQKLCASQQILCYDKEEKEIGQEQPNNKSAQNMVVNADGSSCVPPSTCSLLPFCSYKTVRTDDSEAYNKSGEGKIDCSEGLATGKQYEWLLESTNDKSTGSITGYQDTSLQNETCIRDENIVNSFNVTTHTTDTDGKKLFCACPSKDDENYGDHYKPRYFQSTDYKLDNEGKGYDTIASLKGVYCKSDDCVNKKAQKVDVRQTECQGDLQNASTAQELDIYCDTDCQRVCEAKNTDATKCYVKSDNSTGVMRYQYNESTEPSVNVKSVIASTPKNSSEVNGVGCVDYASLDVEYDDNLFKCKETPYCKYNYDDDTCRIIDFMGETERNTWNSKYETPSGDNLKKGYAAYNILPEPATEGELCIDGRTSGNYYPYDGCCGKDDYEVAYYESPSSEDYSLGTKKTLEDLTKADELWNSSTMACSDNKNYIHRLLEKKATSTTCSGPQTYPSVYKECADPIL